MTEQRCLLAWLLASWWAGEIETMDGQRNRLDDWLRCRRVCVDLNEGAANHIQGSLEHYRFGPDKLAIILPAAGPTGREL